MNTIGPVVLFLTLTLLLVAGTSNASLADNSCVNCHVSLANRLSAPVETYRSGVHFEANIGCEGCHGGDPSSLSKAMSKASGFRGSFSGNASISICSSCHSNPDVIATSWTHIDQEDLYNAGGHGKGAIEGKGVPSCTGCHGSHGILSILDPVSPVHPRNVSTLCGGCHDRESWNDSTGTGAGIAPLKQYSQGAHGKALLDRGNLKAPTCATCHGAHNTFRATVEQTPALCGRCHLAEKQEMGSGAHGAALSKTGIPGCSSCHTPHRTESLGIETLSDRFFTPCLDCHSTGSSAMATGNAMSKELSDSLERANSVREHIEKLSFQGIDTMKMEYLLDEAMSWIRKAGTTSHSVNNSRLLELTGMAEVKLMAAMNLANEDLLELDIRRMTLVLLSITALLVLFLLIFRLRLIERAQKRHNFLNSGKNGKEKTSE